MLIKPENATEGRSFYDLVQEEFACEHPTERVTLTRFTKINGTVEYRKQCLTCGESVAVVKANTIPAAEKASLTEFDRDIKQERGAAWRARYEELKAAHDEARRSERNEEYQEYLRSMEWARKRQVVLVRDDWLCQGCRRARATEVHHLTYDHIFHEFLFELVALCAECHRSISRLDGRI